MINTKYDLFNRSDLDELAMVRSEHAPVFSLYLDLNPERRMTEPPLTRFKALVRQAEQQVQLDERPQAYRKNWAEEIDQLRKWLEMQQPLEGRGLALLSSLSIGLWHAFRLPVPVRDQLEVSDRPYLRPLAILVDEFESYLAVLIDAGTARFFAVRLGTAEEIADVESYVPPSTGDIVEKTSHGYDTYLHRHAKSVIARAESLWRDQDFDWLMVGGTEEELGELYDLLPRSLHERLAVGFYLSPQTDTAKILESVLSVVGEHEQRIEKQRVEELISIAKAQKGGAAVIGLEATLLAIVENRVQTLVIEEEYRSAGWVCPNCHFMGATNPEACPLCGSTLKPEPDIVELALERVLDQDVEIEVLRSAESRGALEQHGHIGALLRYAYSSTEEQERWEQENEEAERVRKLQEKMDEALEESFPASDPPYWMPL